MKRLRPNPFPTAARFESPAPTTEDEMAMINVSRLKQAHIYGGIPPGYEERAARDLVNIAAAHGLSADLD